MWLFMFAGGLGVVWLISLFAGGIGRGGGAL
jgi:hypothetical protein